MREQAYDDATTWPPATEPPAAPSPFSVVRVLLAIAFVVVALAAISRGFDGAMTARVDPLRAPGPALTLETVAPESVLGRLPADPQEYGDLRTQALVELSPGVTGVPDPSPAQLEIYGPGPAGAPPRGLGIVLAMWSATSTPFDQDGYARDVAAGAVKSAGDRAVTRMAKDGGLVVCTETTPGGDAASLCWWIRSASGVVLLAEYGVEPEVVRSDLAVLVRQMTRP